MPIYYYRRPMNGFKLKYKSRIGYNFVEGVTKFSQNEIADQFNKVPLSFTKHAKEKSYVPVINFYYPTPLFVENSHGRSI